MGRIFVIGSLNADLVIEVKRPPRPGETLAGGDLRIVPGGKGANEAVAAARLGASVSMAGAVGSDVFGDLLLESQRKAGVDVSAVLRRERPSGVAVITVFPDGENSIVISPGANGTLTPDDARHALATIAPGDFLLCQLEIPLETVAAALRFAKQAGTRTLLDPAPARPLPQALLEDVDILTPNQTEAAVLLGEPGRAISSTHEAMEAAAQLRRLIPGAAIVKLGKLGSVVAVGEETFTAEPFKVSAVDATAAGDAFNAALACSLLEKRALLDAVRFANAAGALTATRHGAQTALPTRSEVDRLAAC